MNSWLANLNRLIRAVPVGETIDADTADDWGRLSSADKVARAERRAREAHRAGDADLARKWRGIAAEIAGHHKLGG